MPVHDFSLMHKKEGIRRFCRSVWMRKSDHTSHDCRPCRYFGRHLFINGEYANNLMAKTEIIAMVFQNYALYPNMTVLDIWLFALKVRRFSKDLIKQRVEERRKTLEQRSIEKKMPKELSGGQRQRVALGRQSSETPESF
jgi:ABC-type sugar transport system ATPase subunit